MTIRPPAKPVLPTPPTGTDTSSYLRDLVDALSSQLSLKIQTDRAVPELLLRSDKGSVFRLKVGDTGTLYTEIVYQKP